MFNVTNLRQLLVLGYTVEIISDDYNGKSNDADELWRLVNETDTSEIVMTKDNRYQGGAVLTKSFGENTVEVMCIHEGSQKDIFEALEYDSPIKPLQWQHVIDKQFGEYYIAEIINGQFYTIDVKDNGYNVLMCDNEHEPLKTNIKTLDEAKQFVEWNHFRKLLGEFVYGL